MLTSLKVLLELATPTTYIYPCGGNIHSVSLQLLQQMSGRTLLLILFLWAVLTIVTPILVRLSASARAHGEFFVITHTNELIKESMKAGKVMGLLARRALVAAAPRKKHDFEITILN